MNQAQIDKAAQILWNAWDNGETISELPKDCRPTDRQTAYKIQKEVGKLSRSSQIGWKIAATSVNGQKHIGVPGPLAGRRTDEVASAPGPVLSPRGEQEGEDAGRPSPTGEASPGPVDAELEQQVIANDEEKKTESCFPTL